MSSFQTSGGGPESDNPVPTTDEDWEDLLGTGTVLKQVLVPGRRGESDLDMEAPRKFFALIDIETMYEKKLIESESHKNYLINADADLFPGAHLVIPLMDIGEQSRYIFDAKFGYSESGSPPEIPPFATLECIITLKVRAQYDEFLDEMSPEERVKLANRKKERGKFWYSRGNYQNAITIYQSMLDLCLFEPDNEEVEEGCKISEEPEQ